MDKKISYERLVQRILELERENLRLKQAKENLMYSEQKYKTLTENSLVGVFVQQDETFLFVNERFAEMHGYKPDELIGMSSLKLVNPAIRDVARKKISQRIAGEPLQERFEILRLKKNGELFWCEQISSRIEYQGRPAIMGHLIDVTEHKRAEETLREREKEAKRLAQENAIMAEIGRIINSSLDIHEVYERFAEEARKLISFDRISINLINSKDNTSYIAYISGVDMPGRLKGDIVPLVGTTTEYVISTRKSLLIRPEEMEEYSERYPSISIISQAGFRSLMSIPLISKDEIIGILHLHSSGSNIFTEKDLGLAERVGYQITSAIANSLLFAERKRTEDALRDSEERFRDLYDHAPVGYHEYDIEGRITRVNQTDLDMLGYERDEMVGEFMWKFNAEEAISRELILARLAGTIGPAHELERACRRKDGTTFPVLLEDRLILDDQGRITGIRCTMQDITERKRAEQALREKDEFTSSLLENSPIPILVHNEDTSIRYVNPAFEKLTNYTSAEITGKKAPYPWWSAESGSGNIDLLKKNLQKGAREFSVLFRKKNGEPFWVELTTTPVMDNGEFKYSLTTWMDITERKRAEKERESLQARLQRAEKMEAIGTLAGGVAHDLNNMLSGIVSYPDLLLMQIPENSPLRRPIETIQESGKRSAAIVQDLLTLARRGVATTEVFNLNEVVSQYLKSPEHEKLQSFHPDVQVETRLDADLFNILGSPVHLSKVLMNLISNATEAMPEGGRVLVTTENRYIDSLIKGYEHVKEGDYVTLSVSDTGVGISSGDMDRIFEPFFTKKVMGRSGTGLGMAVVWGTVKDHKGYIDVQSVEGKGTVMTLYFPITRKEPVKEMPPSIEEYMGKGESILVVDDVKSQREIASALLSCLGYSVDTVSSGEEAVEYMKNTAVDLIVLDMIMDPGMDGLDAYQRILEIHPGQKAIVASGFSETDRVREAQSLGVGQYIKKPYTLEKIGTAVRKEIDR